MVSYFFVIYSVRMNFASGWNIWLNFRKCVQAKIASFFLLSFRWSFNLRLKAFSLLPTYCIILDEVSKIWFGFYICFSCFIIFEDVCFLYLFTVKIITSFVTRATEKGIFFLLSFSFITLSFKTLLLPIISLIFLFLVYAVIGLPWNAFFSLGLICNKCQCSSMIFLMFGRVLLNFSTNGILGLFCIFVFWS